MKILTLCGSLRAHSSNRAILRAFAHVAPVSMTVDHFDGLGELPHFNPDLDGDNPPASVRQFRERVARADIVVISTPEYAHALPGAFKNALDWLVSDPMFAGKRVAILHVARGSTWALDSLREVLKTMSAVVVEAACVSLPIESNQVDEPAILARPELRSALERSVTALARG